MIDNLEEKRGIFMNFLNGIGQEEEVAIITHTDLDGISSGILIEQVLKSRNIKVNAVFFIEQKPNMLANLLEQIDKKTTRIFLTDINVDNDYETYIKMREKFQVLMIDHHPSQYPEQKGEIKSKTEDCATFIIYKLAEGNFDLENFKWLVCSTMISDMSYKDESNFQFIKSIYPTASIEHIFDSDPGELSKIVSSALVYFKGQEKKVFDLVENNEIMKLEKYYEVVQEEVQRTFDKFKKNAEFYPEKNLYYYYGNPDFSITSTITTLLSVEQPDKTFIFVSDANDNKDYVKVSSRNQSGREDLNILLRKGIEGLQNASAGGHFKASGAVLMKKDLKTFKENLLK